jgi:hypothetical protein
MLRYVESFITATYKKVGLIPQSSRALHLELFIKAVHLRILDL